MLLDKSSSFRYGPEKEPSILSTISVQGKQ